MKALESLSRAPSNEIDQQTAGRKSEGKAKEERRHSEGTAKEERRKNEGMGHY